MIAVGNDELGEPIGDSIVCDKCGKDHQIEYGDEVMEDGTKRQTKLLSFYKCGDKTYLAGIKGRKLRKS